jgi:hypothetical protein
MGLNLNEQAYSHELTNSKSVAIKVIVVTTVVVVPFGIGLLFVTPFFQLFFGAVFIYLMYRIQNVYNSIIGKKLGKPIKIWLNPYMIPLFACYIASLFIFSGSIMIGFIAPIYVGCMINVICLGASVISYIDNVASIGYDPFDPGAFEMNQTQAASSINVGQGRPEILVHRPAFDGDIDANPPQYSEK